MKKFVSVALCTVVLAGWLAIGPGPTFGVAAQAAGAAGQLTSPVAKRPRPLCWTP